VLPPSKKFRQIATTSNATRCNNTFQQRYKKQEYFIIFIFYVKLRQTSSSL